MNRLFMTWTEVTLNIVNIGLNINSKTSTMHSIWTEFKFDKHNVLFMEILFNNIWIRKFWQGYNGHNYGLGWHLTPSMD